MLGHLTRIGRGEERQHLSAGEVDILGGVEAFNHVAEAVGVRLKLAEAIEHVVAHLFHLAEMAVVDEDVQQLLRSVVVRNDTAEGVQLAKVGERLAQTFNAFVRTPRLGHGTSDESFHLAHLVGHVQRMGEARGFGRVADDGGMVGGRIFDACQQEVCAFQRHGVGARILVALA